MKFGSREPDSDERHRQRVLVWKSGATTDVKVVVVTGGAIAVFAASLVVAVLQQGAPRYVASGIAVVAGMYSGALLFGLALGFGLDRLMGGGDDEHHEG